MTTPNKATPEQWADAGAFASDTRACLLELRDRVAALEAAANPPPAPDHSRGAPEMVATDEELVEAFRVCSSLRDIYNLGRQHGAQPRQEGEPTPPPAPAGGLVESVEAAIMREDWLNNDLDSNLCDDDDPTYRYTSAAIDSGDDVHSCQARAAIRVVADWLQQRSDTIANGSQWAEMLRGEAE